MNPKTRETIQYHIDQNMLLRVERKTIPDGKLEGFPLLLSNDFLMLRLVTDFHDEGYSIIRTCDISDAYSMESIAFYETICKKEDSTICKNTSLIQKIETLEEILMSLKDYDGFVELECERQEDMYFLGRIERLESDRVVFRFFDLEGGWDDDLDDIPLENITKISFGSHYAKTLYKYK